ncbi:hypothetical protein [Halorubrum tebenquichense]|uniref:hypothetical protein n=1 Tax=Halorubrum tebenquichense TaxID=119434 RepID=UPI0012692325|nr:hypothetical protein [Halorubrum tebenquichense]
MYVVREHERSNGAFVARHFRHNHSGGDRNCSLGGGESDIHERRKTIALSKALVEFDGECADWGLEEQIGSKWADAYVEFERPHPKYGHGLAIEYQHKNVSKNRGESTENYLTEGFTTVWLWDEQFTDNENVDLFGGEVVTVWPAAVPDQAEWSSTEGFKFDIHPLRSWVTAEQNNSPDRQLRSTSDRVTRHRQQAQKVWDLDLPDSPSVTVRFPEEWYDHCIRSLWDIAPWDLRFDDLDAYDSEEYVAAIRDPDPEIEHSVILPTEYYRELATELRREVPWEEFFPGTIFETNEYLYHPRSGAQSARVKANVPASLSLTDWLIDAERVIRLGNHSTDYDTVPLHDADPDDYYAYLLPYELAVQTDFGGPKRPPGPFDDVQCRNCGAYWNIDEERLECQRCGSDIDWDWNVKSGRIGSLPSYVD